MYINVFNGSQESVFAFLCIFHVSYLCAHTSYSFKENQLVIQGK
jgi:hypothetical protein